MKRYRGKSMGNKDLNAHCFQTQVVGLLAPGISALLQLEEKKKEVMLYSGAIKHMRERHPYAFKKYFNRLTQIVETPDYLGLEREETKRFELIKCYKEIVLVALRLEGGSIFVLSLYIIEENMLKKRLESGKIKEVSHFISLNKEKPFYKNNAKKHG